MSTASLIVAIASALAAIAAAWFARQQRQVADKALKSAEVSADAAKLSADTNAMLAAIEKDRHTQENRPKWRARVERTPKDYSVLWLRLLLDKGTVEELDVELVGFSSFTFRRTAEDHAAGVVDATHAHHGPVREDRSAVWRIETKGTDVDWASATIRLVARRADMQWDDELRLKLGHGEIRSSGYEE